MSSSILPTGLDYTAGDFFGLFPANDPALVDAVIKALDAPADFPIGGRTLREVLLDGVSLSPAPDMLFQLFSYITGGERRQKGEGAVDRRGSGWRCRNARRAGGDREIPRHPPGPGSLRRGARSLAAAALFDFIVAEGNRAALRSTVDAVRYKIGNRTRHGVSSTFLADRVKPGAPLSVYVQKAHAFGLPADPQRRSS